MQVPWASETSRTVDIGRRLAAAVALVVDDTDAMRKITANQLRQMGVQRVVQAADGPDALRLLLANPVNLIIADWQMPGMDGLELLRQVRSLPKGHSIPFVMITAESLRGQVLESVRLGVSELLVKPFTSGRFIERVERALYWRPPAVQADAATAMPAPEPRPETAPEDRERLTVLVVDDTPDNLSLLSELFKDRYRVKVANTGAKAIALCQSEDPPDLVLLDVMMPAMDGFEVAQCLREHPTSEHIPVIFVTALADDAARVRGMGLGAVDFVTKPIQPDTLRVRVANFMRFVELRRNLQADYDHILETQRQREAAEFEQNEGLREPLLRALGALASVPGAAADTARLEVESVLAELAAKERCRALGLGRYVFRPETLKPVRLLRAALARADSEYRSRGLRWSVKLAHALDEDEVEAIGDGPLLQWALLALLRLAGDRAADGTTVRVSVWMRHALRLEIEYPGLVSETERPHWFDQPPVAGVGLVPGPRRLVEAQQGLLTLEPDEAQNLSRLVLTLPTGSGPASSTN